MYKTKTRVYYCIILLQITGTKSAGKLSLWARVYYCIILLQITGAKSAGKLCLWVKFEWSSLNAARPRTTALQTTLYSGSEQRVYFKCKLVMLASGWERGFWWWVGWKKETQYSANMIPWDRYGPLRLCRHDQLVHRPGEAWATCESQGPQLSSSFPCQQRPTRHGAMWCGNLLWRERAAHRGRSPRCKGGLKPLSSASQTPRLAQQLLCQSEPLC